MNTQKPKPSQSDRAAAYVKEMEPAIERSGGDRQTFVVCCKLVEFGLAFSEAFKVLLEFNRRCQPPWGEAALSRKLKCAYARASPNSKFTEDTGRKSCEAPEIKEVSRWPKPNNELRQSIVESGGGLADLCDLSPVQFDVPRPELLLPILFPNDPLICCGKSSQVFWTQRISEFGDWLSGMQFVVPSPMSKLLGKIQDPEPDGPFESAHTKDNTGDRRYAVVEFDQGSSDEHAALLWHLSNYAPFVMAVHSGGKSLHGWFYVGGSPEELVFQFYRYAVWIGADRATHLKSQFVRMPGGRRDSGVAQPVYYFNPEAIG